MFVLSSVVWISFSLTQSMKTELQSVVVFSWFCTNLIPPNPMNGFIPSFFTYLFSNTALKSPFLCVDNSHVDNPQFLLTFSFPDILVNNCHPGAPTCLFTEQSVTQYHPLSDPLGHVFLLIFSAQLLEHTAENCLCRCTWLFIKCVLSVFPCTLWL